MQRDDNGLEAEVKFSADASIKMSERESLMSVNNPVVNIDEAMGGSLVNSAGAVDTYMANSVILEQVLMKVSKDVDVELKLSKGRFDEVLMFVVMGLMLLSLMVSAYGYIAGWDVELLFNLLFNVPIFLFVSFLVCMFLRGGIYGEAKYSNSKLLRDNFNEALKFVSMKGSVCKNKSEEPSHLLRLIMILANNENLKVDSSMLLGKIKKEFDKKVESELKKTTSKGESLSNEVLLGIKEKVTNRYYKLMCDLYMRKLEGREDIKRMRGVLNEIKDLSNVSKASNKSSKAKDMKSEADKFIEESLGGDLIEFNKQVLNNLSKGA